MAPRRSALALSGLLCAVLCFGAGARRASRRPSAEKTAAAPAHGKEPNVEKVLGMTARLDEKGLKYASRCNGTEKVLRRMRCGVQALALLRKSRKLLKAQAKLVEQGKGVDNVNKTIVRTYVIICSTFPHADSLMLLGRQAKDDAARFAKDPRGMSKEYMERIRKLVRGSEAEQKEAQEEISSRQMSGAEVSEADAKSLRSQVLDYNGRQAPQHVSVMLDEKLEDTLMLNETDDLTSAALHPQDDKSAALVETLMLNEMADDEEGDEEMDKKVVRRSGVKADQVALAWFLLLVPLIFLFANPALAPVSVGLLIFWLCVVIMAVVE